MDVRPENQQERCLAHHEDAKASHMTTCPTCGYPTDTSALAFLHERWHASPSAFMRTVGLAYTGPTIAELMEAYAQQAAASDRHHIADWKAASGCQTPEELRQRIDAIEIRLTEHCRQLEQVAESAQQALAAWEEAATEIAHRLGLADELSKTETNGG